MNEILEFVTPESVGISSKAITDFVLDIQEREIMLHSFILMRHGKVCAELYCPPFKKDEFHRMYSTSKSFASMALGILIGEGKVKFEDKIADYFPEYRNENTHEWILNITVKDALMMSSTTTEGVYSIKDKNFISNLFSSNPLHPSGMIFNYDTNATNCITSIVEKVSGKPFMEFLKEKALLEIGFSKDSSCVQMPQGGSWGGSGVLCSTRDLARFALLVYNDGYSNGKQLLPKDYVVEAKSFQTDNCTTGHKDKLRGHGYGYQIWRIFENGYAFLGMGGQCMFAFPDYDLIYCMTADVQGNPNSYIQFAEALYYNIMKSIKKFDKTDSIPENASLKAELDEIISNFKAPVPSGKDKTSWTDKINGKVYKTPENPMGINSFYLTFDNGKGVFHYDTQRGEKQIPFAFGEYLISEFPENHYSGHQVHVPLGHGYRSMSAGAWVEDNKLAIRTYVIDDYFGNLNTLISFKDNFAAIRMCKTAEGFLDEYNGETVGELIKPKRT